MPYTVIGTSGLLFNSKFKSTQCYLQLENGLKVCD